jgi:hypothetical protein
MQEAIRIGAIVHGLLERIAHQLSPERGADAPAACIANGSIADGVYFCDSSAFPRSSAFSPTLIMITYAGNR